MGTTYIFKNERRSKIDGVKPQKISKQQRSEKVLKFNLKRKYLEIKEDF
jgi:hypothetical protein